MPQDRIVSLSTGLAADCPYHLGDGILDLLPDFLRAHPFDEVFLVTGESLVTLLGADMARTLTAADIPTTVVTVAEGEANKSWPALTRLCEQLVAAGLTRDSLVVSLGGGMVANLVGLAAGLIYRGIRHVDVPTTMLNITDGALSNKQAINGLQGKNQFGLYKAPLFIWADVAYIRSEPPRQVKSAIVEGIKNGLVNDRTWFERLERTLDDRLTAVHGDLCGFVRAVVQSKLDILAQDPGERGMAIVLEYGHTVGHAVEWLSDGRFYHGEAVGIGMCAAARLGVRLGLTPVEVLERQEHLIGDVLRSPVAIPADLSPERLVDVLLSDNKRGAGDDIRFILLEDVGRPHNPSGDYTVLVPQPVVKTVLADR